MAQKNTNGDGDENGTEQFDQFRSKRLRKRLRELQQIVDEELADSFRMEVEEMERGLISVIIKSSENFWNEGELGTDKMHLVMGPRGGIKRADMRDEFSGFETSYGKAYRRKHGARRQWRRIKGTVERFS